MSVFYLVETGPDELEECAAVVRNIVYQAQTTPEVRHFAEQAIGEGEPLSSLFNFVKTNFGYAPDPRNMELFIGPWVIAQDYFAGRKRAGDCDDHAILDASLLRSVGYDARVAFVSAIEPNEYDHALCEVNTSLGWIEFDTTSHYPMGWKWNYNLHYPIEM